MIRAATREIVKLMIQRRCFVSFGIRSTFAVSALAVLQLFLYIEIYRLGNLSQTIFVFLVDYVLLFGSYVVTFVFCRSSDLESGNRFLQAVLVVFPLMFRMIMIMAETSLSTDIFRYMWDGMLLANGIDPYKYVPSSRQLQSFQNIYYYEIYDHKDELTVYPPVAQYLFSVSYALFGASQQGFKSVITIFDILNGLLIALVIMKLGAKRTAYLGAMLYLWNPLVIVEFSGSGHVDAFAIFFLLLSIYMLLNLSTFNSAASLAASSMTKWITLPIIPFYLKAVFKQKPRFLLRAISSLVICSLVIVLPFILNSGFNFVTSVAKFASNWRFESALSRLFVFILNANSLEEFLVLKVLSYIMFAVLYVTIFFKARISGTAWLIDYSILTVCLLYLIVPAVYPWYSIWLLALTSLRNGFRHWTSISSTGIAVVNYAQQFCQLSNVLFWGLYALWYVPVFAIILSYLPRSWILRTYRVRSW